MREALKLASLILISIGTLCLLLNELIFEWGRTATLAFAATNLLGFATLVWSMKKARKQ